MLHKAGVILEKKESPHPFGRGVKCQSMPFGRIKWEEKKRKCKEKGKNRKTKRKAK
jgi:hypothetical protein